MPEEKIFTLKLTADGLEVSSPNSEPKKPEPKVCGESDIHTRTFTLNGVPLERMHLHKSVLPLSTI